ncbi:MAG: efflux RND transporter periplasmic adaptor subunit [Ignavibacteriae bacterium]|nr:efflux RND transporter periplasmic adaptor subunit [Ignavibacteriota bacterium]
MKISNKIIYIIVTIILLSLFVYSVIPNQTNEETEANSYNVDYNKLDEIIFNVKTTKVFKGDLVQTITANGIVRAEKELDITSNINGIINEINIYEGKYVNKNEVLISFDDREYKVDLREAEERIIEAKVSYGLLIKDAPADTVGNIKQIEIEKKLKKLEEDYTNNQIAENEYLKLKEDLEMKLIFTGAKREELILNKSGYNAAINQIDRAKLNLEYTKIKAPFSGVIGNFDLVVGQRSTAGNTLFKLFSSSIMQISIDVLESELNKIKIGNKAEIEIPAFQSEKFIGKVERISPYIDTENRTCKVIISLKNIDHKVKPGMYVNVKITSNILTTRNLIPKEALLNRDKRNLVFTVEDSLAKWKYVDIGEQNDEYIEILNGVEAGENLIIEGQFNLAHDSKVRIIN